MGIRRHLLGLVLLFALSSQFAAAAAPAIETVVVPAGTFQMGSPKGATWEQPRHDVSTPAFEIAARPVSNAEFRAFRPSHISPSDDADDAPVTGVSWFDAQAYCEWLSKETGRRYVLPTEAWWEKAARGGLEGGTYPWGEDPPVPPGSDQTSAPPRPNAYGVYAVSYNLWEWAEDWYAADYFSKSPRDDPRGPKEGDFRVLRGGGFRADPSSATCHSRGSARPETASPYITFRVAVDLSAATVITQTSPSAPPPVRPQPRPAPVSAPPSAPAVAPARPTASQGAESLDVRGIEFAEENDSLIIKVATSDAARFKTMQLSGPERLVVDLPGATLADAGDGRLDVGKQQVERVRYSQFQIEPPVVRVVVDMAVRQVFQIENWPNELRIILRRNP